MNLLEEAFSRYMYRHGLQNKGVVVRLIERELEKRGLSVPHEKTIYSWMSGADPKDDKTTAVVLEILGGRIDRALPDYDPINEAIILLQEEIQQYGSPKSLQKNKKAELAELLAKVLAIRQQQQKQPMLDDRTRNEVIRDFLQSNLKKLPDVEVE